MGRQLLTVSLVLYLLVLLLSLVHPSRAFQGGVGVDVGIKGHFKNGIVLPLVPHSKGNTAEGRRRSLLRSKRNVTLPLYGAVKDLGYFYASLYLGTPPKRFTVIVDTGSTMTYVPCATCGNGCGPNHQDAAFDPRLSSSATLIGCESDKCRCGTPACTCSPAQQCSYTRSYAEQSSSSGILVEDVLHLHDELNAVPVIFGCETYETGEIYKQQADGLFGLGNSDSSLVSQLARSGVIENTFSLCFGVVQGDGALLLGDSPALMEVDMQFTPLLSHPQHPYYYNVQLDSITVNDQVLPVPADVFSRTGYGTVLDSGTTFTYFPTSVFTSFVAAVETHALHHGLVRVAGPDPVYDDICFGNAPEAADLEALTSVFPELELAFGGGIKLRLNPLNYLFVHTFNSGKYCLGVFDNGNAGTLLGGISFRNVLVNYDRRNNRIGFGPAACRELGLRYRPPCSAFGKVGNEMSAAMAAAAGDCIPDDGGQEPGQDDEAYDEPAEVSGDRSNSNDNNTNSGPTLEEVYQNVDGTSSATCNQPSVQTLVLLSSTLVLLMAAIVVGLFRTRLLGLSSVLQWRPRLEFWWRYEPILHHSTINNHDDPDIELSKGQGDTVATNTKLSVSIDKNQPKPPVTELVKQSSKSSSSLTGLTIPQKLQRTSSTGGEPP